MSSFRTGRIYYVEPIFAGNRVEWGSIDPASGKLMHKKGDGKYAGAIKSNESLITIGNGFEKIHNLEVGVSPFAYIDHLDAQYPDRTV